MRRSQLPVNVVENELKHMILFEYVYCGLMITSIFNKPLVSKQLANSSSFAVCLLVIVAAYIRRA